MARKVSVDVLCRIGVSVEVDHADVAETMVLGDRGRGGPGDGMVAAENHGNDAAARDLAHALLNRGARRLPHSVAHDRVAEVDDIEVVEHLYLKVEVVASRVVSVRPHRPGTEASARSVGRVVIPWGADDRDIGLPLIELLGLGQKRAHAKSGETLKRR